MRKVFGERSLFLAPLVNGSDMAFRMLAREYGAEVTYTEMVHCKYFKPELREFEFTADPAADRPLILQVAGGVHEAVQIIEMVEHPVFRGHIDGVDLNCGCPMDFAIRKKLGAALLRDHDALVDMVARIAARISYPLSVKLRLTEDLVGLVGRLKSAGASAVTLHARDPSWRGDPGVAAQWSAIRQIAEAHRDDSLFVIGNGNVEAHGDALRMLEATGCDAAMVGYSALLRPSVFSRSAESAEHHLRRYFVHVEHSRRHRLVDLQRHAAWLLQECCSGDSSLRAKLFTTQSQEQLQQVAMQLARQQQL